MFRLIRKAVMVGIGFGAQGFERLDEFEKEGERSQKEYAKAARSLLSELEKNSEKLERKCRSAADRVFERSPIPTRSDFNRLEKKVHDLAARIERGGKA